MKTKTVLLPITTPDSIWCFNKEKKQHCQYFFKYADDELRCYNGFVPLEIENGKWEKPEDCKSLLWEENIR